VLSVNGLRLSADAPITSPVNFRPGEITVVLGRNQSGKSALCRLIAGLPSAAQGSITLDGVDLFEVPAQRRPIALVYQVFVNYPTCALTRHERYS
jgi:glycerol transport system ATP-binding protein